MATITCVIDNAALERVNLQTEHGVAFWLQLPENNILFDTGASADALKRNLKTLDLSLKDLDALALSHAHYDHTGGIEAVLGYTQELPIFACADIFRPKYSKHDGNYDASGFVMQRDDYADRAEWRLNDNPVEIVAGLWTTGRIVERAFPEGRSAGHFIREEGDFVPDPYLDDMSLVLKTENGLVVICGCCHAGILNTLVHVQAHFDGEIRGVVGGIHLMVADKALIREVIGKLKEMAPEAQYWLNHCTGIDALNMFRDAFGNNAHHFKAGKSIQF